ncbi:ketose-bisphosphate aldolase [Treponema parvum]|uniref:ketose-bisphosphate aldolase n=1 Tax=Treponema parvum TaxID=138851 RepID=UPI001AEC0FA0|nr:ketose-bisphosphate aldolase [Treponema parvum]QTQ15392.1 ketose-bisphosphate aldolase [Treponema parvum]
MYRYKDLGLVNINEMMKKAYIGQYAVPALNFISIEQLNAICDAVISKRSPVMLLVSPNLHSQLGPEMIARLAQCAADRIRNSGINSEIALHLDHGKTFEQCVYAIENGFSSVMIDGSALSLEANIELTKKVVTYAHAHNVSVEGELGALCGVEESSEKESGQNMMQYTDPLSVKRFVDETHVDCLAIAIGTAHGLVKMKYNPDGTLPKLRFDILDEIEHLLPGFPIVLHGASAIKKEFIDMINTYGGEVKEAVGIPEDQVSEAAKKAVCKVNIASDGWIAALALTRKILAENRDAIDSRVFTLKIRPILASIYEHKIDILGSSGKSEIKD